MSKFFITFFILCISKLPILGQGLAIGDTIPDVSVVDENGAEVKLRNLSINKTSVIIFYRGGWCPFCNAHLSDLQDYEKDFRKKGVQIMAISPENTAELQNTKGKNDLKYRLFTDNKGAAIKFGVASMVAGKVSLPIPSVFVIDKNNIVQFIHANPDYKVRMDGYLIESKINEILK